MFMQKKVWYLVLGLMVILSMVMASCAPKTAVPTEPPAAATQAPVATAVPPTDVPTAAPVEKVTLRFGYNWTGGDAKAPFYEAALQAYMETHKDTVEIILEGTPGDEHRNKVKVDLAGNNLADVLVYWTGEPTLRPYIDAGAIIDIDTVLAKSAKTARNQWTDSMLENSIVDGKLWTLPVEAFKCYTLYNKSIFDQYAQKPPTTYAELKAVADVFNANGIVPLDMGSKGGNPGHLFFNQLVLQFENGLVDINSISSAFTVNTPAFNSAAAAVEQMANDGIFPDDTIANGDWGPSIVLYNEGKAAMLYSCPWMIGAIKPEIAAVSEAMDLPALDGGTISPSTFNIGGVTMGVVVNKASFEDPAKQAAIVDFVDFLVSDEVFTELGKASMMPAKNVKLDASILDPLFVKIVDFTSTQSTYPVIWSVLPSAADQEVFSEGMDELFAGAPAADVIQKIETALAKEKP